MRERKIRERSKPQDARAGMPQREILIVEGSAGVVDVCASCAVPVDDVAALAHEALDLWVGCCVSFCALTGNKVDGWAEGELLILIFKRSEMRR